MEEHQVNHGLAIANELESVVEYIRDIPGIAMQKARARITEQAAEVRTLVLPDMPKRSA